MGRHFNWASFPELIMADLLQYLFFHCSFRNVQWIQYSISSGPPSISIKSAVFGGVLSSWKNIDSLNPTLGFIILGQVNSVLQGYMLFLLYRWKKKKMKPFKQAFYLLPLVLCNIKPRRPRAPVMILALFPIHCWCFSLELGRKGKEVLGCVFWQLLRRHSCLLDSNSRNAACFPADRQEEQ